MTTFTKNMPHDATYWPPGANDGTGGRTPGDPVAIKCRWQDNNVLFRDGSGQQVTSQAVVYPDRALALRGRLKRGTLTGAPPADALEIRQVNSTDNLSGTSTLNKVFL
jgi:hypothetical protein